MVPRSSLVRCGSEFVSRGGAETRSYFLGCPSTARSGSRTGDGRRRSWFLVLRSSLVVLLRSLCSFAARGLVGGREALRAGDGGRETGDGKRFALRTGDGGRSFGGRSFGAAPRSVIEISRCRYRDRNGSVFVSGWKGGVLGSSFFVGALRLGVCLTRRRGDAEVFFGMSLCGSAALVSEANGRAAS